jgi:hypothetical protein
VSSGLLPAPPRSTACDLRLLSSFAARLVQAGGAHAPLARVLHKGVSCVVIQMWFPMSAPPSEQAATTSSVQGCQVDARCVTRPLTTALQGSPLAAHTTVYTRPALYKLIPCTGIAASSQAPQPLAAASGSGAYIATYHCNNSRKFKSADGYVCLQTAWSRQDRRSSARCGGSRTASAARAAAVTAGSASGGRKRMRTAAGERLMAMAMQQQRLLQTCGRAG